ncbi:MAG: glycosyltransferase [Rhodobacteraceae bacterium]|nr:glycosyltransferase [Paracoccaceae bacterium]
MSSRPIKLLQLVTYYKGYLRDFYDSHPQLKMASFADQISSLEADGFGEIHTYANPLKRFGFDTMHVIANNDWSQGAWLRENGIPIAAVASAPDVALKQIESFAPEIVYTLNVEEFSSPYFRRLSRPPSLLVGWRGFPLKPDSDLSAFDLILTSFDRIEREATERGARHVARFHPGFNAASSVLREPREIEWDVVVSGTVTREHQQRIAIINMLAELSRDPAAPFRLGLFLPDASALSPLAQSLNRGARWANDMFRLLRRSRIVVNIDVDSFGGQPPNMRLIEATGVGALLLTTYHSDLEKFFEPGAEVETFRTPQELISKLYFFLSSPEAGEQIARRGQERCLRDHNLDGRAAWLSQIVRDALERKANSAV